VSRESKRIPHFVDSVRNDVNFFVLCGEAQRPILRQRRSECGIQESYMGIGSLAWRTMYQQGRLPAWGKMEWLQGTSSSGWTASISYSTLLPLEEMASRRMR
jgi:hypothetical protein